MRPRFDFEARMGRPRFRVRLLASSDDRERSRPSSNTPTARLRAPLPPTARAQRGAGRMGSLLCVEIMGDRRPETTAALRRSAPGLARGGHERSRTKGRRRRPTRTIVNRDGQPDPSARAALTSPRRLISL